MITITRTFDADFIESVCKHPKIWKSISDDNSNFEEWKPTINDDVYWLAPVVDGEAAGVFLVYPLNSILWEVHTSILPEYWGETCLECAKAVIKYVFENTECKKLITNVPRNNPLAKRLAEKAGMSIEYINKKSIMKCGMMMDQFVLAIYKEN